MKAADNNPKQAKKIITTVSFGDFMIGFEDQSQALNFSAFMKSGIVLGSSVCISHPSDLHATCFRDRRAGRWALAIHDMYLDESEGGPEDVSGILKDSVARDEDLPV